MFLIFVWFMVPFRNCWRSVCDWSHLFNLFWPVPLGRNGKMWNKRRTVDEIVSRWSGNSFCITLANLIKVKQGENKQQQALVVHAADFCIYADSCRQVHLKDPCRCWSLQQLLQRPPKGFFVWWWTSSLWVPPEAPVIRWVVQSGHSIRSLLTVRARPQDQSHKIKEPGFAQEGHKSLDQGTLGSWVAVMRLRYKTMENTAWSYLAGCLIPCWQWKPQDHQGPWTKPDPDLILRPDCTFRRGYPFALRNKPRSRSPELSFYARLALV